jgi:putative transposase
MDYLLTYKSRFLSAPPTYLDLLASWGIRVSMNGKGRALDNARTERFFRSLKYDDIYINEYVTPREMIKGVNNYMSTYNTIRPHASLGGLSPQAFKATHMQKAVA